MEQKIKRREFLKLAAGAASGLALSGCSVSQLAPLTSADADEEWPAHLEQWIPSACLQCEGGCGLRARVVDGQVVKLEGNPLHPINRGRLCPLGQAGLQLLYHPDRIKAPMRRVGGKGSNQWIRIGWDEAIKTVAAALRDLRQRGEPHALIVLDGQTRGLMRILLERFCEAFGTPNHISTAPSDGTNVAHDLMQGINEPFGYDLENANYILSFGCDLLDGWRSPVHLARAYGYLRQERPGAKAKIVHVGRRFSTTAAKADEWVPINPGSEGALALAIAYVIIREELYDREFIEKHTFGFHDWPDAGGVSHPGFKTLVLKEYRPDDVAGLTGIPVDTIIRLAKEFAQSRPAIALADGNATHYVNGTYTALSIHALNALVGSIETPGGILVEEHVPFKPMPPLARDALAEKGLRRPRIGRSPGAAFPLAGSAPERIPEDILSSKPYQVNAVFLYSSNPLFSTRVEAEFRRALERVPLVVSFSSFMDETAEHADLLLPDHVYLEKWLDALAPPVFGIPVLSMAQPVVKPLYNTMHAGDVLLQLAGEIGGSVAEAAPWRDFKELLTSAIEGVYQAEGGAIFSEPSEEAYARELQKRGWVMSRFSDPEAFWQELVRKGGWWGLYHSYNRSGKIFNTPSGKFEFYSQRLASRLETAARAEGRNTDDLLAELNVPARGDKALLPHYEPITPAARASEYPFFLNPFNALVLSSADSANLPWVQEMVGPHVNVRWDSWAEINPETARKLGIEDGDWIWIESARGKLRTHARLYPGAMPNVVNIPFGLGHKASGRWARDRGVNPNALIEIAHDRLSGLPAWFSTRVKIYKA